jgi:hypothetical protein
MEAKGECHLLFVPVRASALGTLALRTGRLPSGPPPAVTRRGRPGPLVRT